MAPAAQRYHVEIILDSNPSSGLQNLTAVLRVLEIIVGVMFSHRPVGVITGDRGVEEGALLALRWRALQCMADFGNIGGYPEALWPILLPLTTFLWAVKVSITNIVAQRLASMVVDVTTLHL